MPKAQKGFYFQHDFHSQLTGISEAAYDRIAGAIARYYFDGTEPKRLKGMERNIFEGMRQRVEIARRKSEAQTGKKAGKGAKEAEPMSNLGGTYVEPRSNLGGTYQEPKTPRQVEPSSDLSIKSESESEKESTTAAAVVQGGGGMEIVGEKDGLARFLAHALKEWNNRFQTAYTAFPGDARRGLAEAFGAGHGPADVDRVLEVVATWEPRFRTPNAAFADGRFEQWLNRPEEKAPAVERPPETAECPECGHERAQITPGSPLYRCEECGITWRAAS